MRSPPFRGRIASYIFETHNVTSTCQNILLWQTRQQRNKHDMAQKVRHYDYYNIRRGEEEGEESRRRFYDDERLRKYEGHRNSWWCDDDLRKKLDSVNRRKRNDNNLMGTRSRSYSRVRREHSRGRSRSPRSPGVQGPSILKKRSQSAHGRGWGGDTIVSGKTWKRFRINTVDQVFEYNPSPEVVGDECFGTEQEQEDDSEDLYVRDGTLSTNRKSNIKTSPKLGEKVSTKKKNVAKSKKTSYNDNVKKSRSIIKTKSRDNEGPFISETDGNNNISEDDTLHLQSDHTVHTVDNIEQSKADNLHLASLLNAEDSRLEATHAQEKTKAGFTESEVFNQNDLIEDEDFHGFDLEDISKNYLGDEEDIHEYEMTDLGLTGGDDIPVEDLNKADDQKGDCELTIVFSGGYHTRKVPCQHKDCPAQSTPSTIGLLPFSTKPGHEWLCPDHAKCLLCSDTVDNINSVMCVMCARVFHTSHLLDLGIEKKDMMELVCKLCSDPERFIPAQKQGCLNRKGGRKSRLAKNKRSNTTITSSRYLTKCGTTSKRKIMSTDHSLPSGWSRQIVNNSVNRNRVVISGPDGRKYWSRRDLEKAFKHMNDGVEWQYFSFSLYTSTKK